MGGEFIKPKGVNQFVQEPASPGLSRVQIEGVFVRVNKGTAKEVRQKIMADMIAATNCTWVRVQVR